MNSIFRQPDLPDTGQDDFSEEGSEYGYKDSDEGKEFS